ncbi:hypothetical protein GCM10011490_09780 [Pseudoclavibacter endophyticus]|uniref:Winged helix-turn-helix transcriptional regulator n=1 Tax=Pseudoclavibacter endophyticus TaxID=1778590 RepID=A0A6H9WTH1_9MICO|nr:MarR family winged helix-turn-helix transcriptional regulator [Pseudoclavibacter endophyticus]KAB1649570.1 winged helix-turn-helix transcriptional regulator [Pseudoclavibacter endophyticus]GGA61533.1 hypothetical protein GCM10011490_09780 [Pseudoclavibacter endophyticus]
MTSHPGHPGGEPTGDAPEDPSREAAIISLESSFVRLVRAFRAQMAALAEATSPGMVPGTLKAFIAIEQHGPMPISALAEHLALDKGLVSRTVSELEELGFVERSSATDDRRIRIVSATPLGSARLSAAREGAENPLSARIHSWPTPDIEQLRTLLDALADGTPPTEAVHGV